MRKLTIIFIAATICSILNCITFLVEGNIPAFAGWFVSSCALVLLHMLFGGWQKLKAGYEAEIAKYKRDLDESWEREKIAKDVIAEKRKEIARLTKWNDPNKPPQHEKRVIVDAVLPNGARFVTGGWYAINEYPQGWSVDIDRVFENVSVIGWREIPE